MKWMQAKISLVTFLPRLVLIIGFFCSGPMAFSQNLIGISGSFSVQGSAGLTLGYYNVDRPMKLGFAGIYFGRGDNNIKTVGILEVQVDQADFIQDVTEQGINYNWRGVIGGLNLHKNFSAGLSMGTRTRLLTQQRFDVNKLRGINGQYYTQYKEVLQLDIGLLLLGHFNIHRGWYVLSKVNLTRLNGLMFGAGIAVRTY
ncbi:MAG: hypothetical protein ACI8QD_002397 [Cyclobacteriaceae bacterium]|jgi:hypothetical protein